jgi:hypothetical protein
MQVMSIKAKDKLKFVALCPYLFIISLTIPKISLLFLLLLPLVLKFFGYLRIPKYLLKSTGIPISIVSMILFTIINYCLVYSYGLDEKSAGIYFIEAVMIIVLFLTGICLDFKKMPFFPFNLLVVNLSLFSGGIVWVFLSVAHYNKWSFSFASIAIAERKVPAFWQGSDVFINGPSLDIYSYLGVSLVGLFIVLASIGSFIGKYRKSILLTFIFILIFMSCYSSISLGARTPVIVLLISIVVTILFINFFNQSFQASRWIMICFYVSIACMVLFFREILNEYLLELISSLLDLNIGNRLISQGLETPRYIVWQQVIDQMPDYPWGGRLMLISASYAHNIWLDQMYDSGILSMLLLLTFHIVQIPILLQFFKLDIPKIIRVFVLCTFVAFLAAFIQAPVIQASCVYFAISCFFFGSVARFTSDYKFMVSSSKFGIE